MSNIQISNSVVNANVYAEWLGTMPWDFFCTYTTQYTLTTKSARRLMERYHSRLTDKVCENVLFWAAEPFDTKEGCHTHALLYLKDRSFKEESGGTKDFNLARMSYQMVVGKEDPGRCHLSRYKPDVGAHGYVGKYIQKYKCDYDIFFS